MKNLYKFIEDNIFFKRIFSIRQSIAAYSLASFLDIIIILIISNIFSKITSEEFKGNIYLYFLSSFIFIFFRTVSVFCLRRFAFNKIFKKKLIYEKNLVEYFVDNRIKVVKNNEEDLKVFKEKLINSSNLATVNFDIPVFSIFAESIFALGGVFILLSIFGLNLLLLNLPVFILLIIISKMVSKKLSTLGTKILDFTDRRINAIDNISEISIELSALKYPRNLSNYFLEVNKPYN